LDSLPAVAVPFLLPFFLRASPAILALLSFPTRRSSDLYTTRCHFLEFNIHRICRCYVYLSNARSKTIWVFLHVIPPFSFCLLDRSEEHTSELQSRFELVCRLLLE